MRNIKGRIEIGGYEVSLVLLALTSTILSSCSEPSVEPVVRDDRDDKIRQLEAENQRLRSQAASGGEEKGQNVSTPMEVQRVDSKDPFKMTSPPESNRNSDPFAGSSPAPKRDSREDVWKSLIGEALYEVKLSDGSILPGGTIRRVDSNEVLLSHANGIAVLKLAEATPKIQKMCLYDPNNVGWVATNAKSKSAPVVIGNVGGFAPQPVPKRKKPAPRMVKMPPKKVYARKIPDETTLRLKISRAEAKIESLRDEKVTLRRHYESEDYRYYYRRISVRTSAAQRSKNLTDIDDEIGRQQGDINEAEVLLDVLEKREKAELEAQREPESETAE